MRQFMLIASAGVLLVTPAATAEPTPIDAQILAIEQTDQSVWKSAYRRLLTALRERQDGSLRPFAQSRQVDEVALHYLDRALLSESIDPAQLASTIEQIRAPELEAAGYVSLARKTGAARWLRSALDALSVTSAPEEYATNLAAAVADTAMEFGDLQLAAQAVAAAEPGPVRASIASRLARSKGVDPAAFESWTSEVEDLAEEGDLRSAIELAVAAEAWEEREERDEILRDLAVKALDELGPASAVDTVNAMYYPRMRGLALKDIVEALSEAGRIDEAVRMALEVREPQSASAVWLQLAEHARSKAERADRLERAYAFARRVDEEPTRADSTADVLKRVAERDWYATAYRLSDCIPIAEERERVVLAAAKRAAELNDTSASERILEAWTGEESEASQEAREALAEAKEDAGAEESDSSGRATPAADLQLEPTSCGEESGRGVPVVRSVAPKRGLIAPAQRNSTLMQMAASSRKSFCAAENADPDLQIEPIEGLKSTDEYGSDQRAEKFSWTVMVLAGRHLGGNGDATKRLTQMLSQWAEAGAFEETEVSHDSYYALKRSLLPTVVAFTLVESEMAPDDAARVRDWLDGLVRRLDKRFDGDVDHNNHRYLADSVQMTWGSWTGDAELFRRGIASLEMAQKDLRADGSLPLETRRGARALWYMRQAASSFTVMIHLLERQGMVDLAKHYREALLLPVIDYLIDGILYPSKVLIHSAENYIPGPSDNYFEQDLGFLQTRGHDRHYMAWIEPLLAYAGPSITLRRLRLLAARDLFEDRPLVDEFAGGNATCFWANDATMRGHG